MERHIELNLGNVILITLIAAVGVAGVIMLARAGAKTTIPVVDKASQGYLTSIGVAA